MPRDELTVTDLDVFEMPTASLGTEIYNAGDGKWFREEPGRPVTLGFLGSGGSGTVTVSAAPNAPGSPGSWTSGTITNTHVLVIPPGFFSSSIYRRDDDQVTDPGTIYIDASGTGVNVIAVRGPAMGGRKSRGTDAGEALGSARDRIDPVSMEPGQAVASSLLTMSSANDNAFWGDGSECFAATQAAGTASVLFEPAPENPYGATANLSVAIDTANDFFVIPPGVIPLDWWRRSGGTDTGACYLQPNTTGVRYSISRLSRHRTG